MDPEAVKAAPYTSPGRFLYSRAVSSRPPLAATTTETAAAESTLATTASDRTCEDGDEGCQGHQDARRHCKDVIAGNKKQAAPAISEPRNKP